MHKLLLAFLICFFSSELWCQEDESSRVQIDSSTETNENYSIEEDNDKNEDSITLLKIDSTLYPFIKHNALIDSAKKIAQQADYWYVTANFKPQKQKEAVQEDRSNSGFWGLIGSEFFNVMLWVLFGGIILTILLFFLTENDIIRFRRRALPLSNEEVIESEDNIFEIDFEKKITEAIASNNFTLATRLLLFRLLKKLTLKNHLVYNPQKTNLDYQIELSSKSFSQSINRCFYFYDNVCYGDFEISPSQFMYVQDFFNQTEKLI
jgi:hypothetical protein